MNESFRKIEIFRNLTNTNSGKKESSGFRAIKPINQPVFISPEKPFKQQIEVMDTVQTLSKIQQENQPKIQIRPFGFSCARTRTRICKVKTSAITSKRVILKNPKVQISFEIVNLIN